MNWDRIRKYLIFMLLAVNIMLISSISKHNNNTSIDNPYFSKSNIENFQQLTESRGLRVEAELPKDIHIVGSFNTEYRNFNKENHGDLLEDYPNIRTFDNSKRIQLTLKEMKQTIDDNKYNILNQAQRLAFAEKFLEKYFPMNQYARIATEDENLLSYKVSYEGFLLEESYINFKFGSAMAVITATDLTPLEASANKVQSITSVEAVLNALPELKEGDIIEQIELVYHFEMPEEDLYKVDYIRSFPHWKLTTAERGQIFVLAMPT